jgi:ABC-type transport system involved in multi-copper enzyme maturation permease subunit
MITNPALSEAPCAFETASAGPDDFKPNDTPGAICASGHHDRCHLSRIPNQTGAVAIKEFSDRLRSGWVIVCALVWLGAIGLTSLFGLVQIGRIGIQGYDRTVASLLSLVQYLVPLLGLLLGHDLLVAEREERTLSFLIACGVARGRVLMGKFLGGALALAFPLVLGFLIVGTVIALSAKDHNIFPFFVLALSGLGLGLVFLAAGLAISAICRTRVQALVCALLTWCVAVFAFDLVAMGLVVTLNSTQAAREIEQATDATHVISVADMHKAFEGVDNAAERLISKRTQNVAVWLALNPVDVFRALNLPKSTGVSVPGWLAGLSICSWLAGSLGFAAWKFRRIDL